MKFVIILFLIFPFIFGCNRINQNDEHRRKFFKIFHIHWLGIRKSCFSFSDIAIACTGCSINENCGSNERSVQNKCLAISNIEEPEVSCPEWMIEFGITC